MTRTHYVALLTTNDTAVPGGTSAAGSGLCEITNPAGTLASASVSTVALRPRCSRVAVAVAVRWPTTLGTDSVLATDGIVVEVGVDVDGAGGAVEVVGALVARVVGP